MDVDDPGPPKKTIGFTWSDRSHTADEDLRVVADSGDFAIIIMDGQRRITHWSSGAERLTGWSPQEAVGRVEYELIFSPEDRAAEMPQREQENAAREGRSETEHWHLRKDGTQFWGAAVLTPLYDRESGSHRGFGKLLRDITRQKRLEDELRGLFEESLDALLIVGDAAALLDANAAGSALEGQAGESVVGRRVFDLLPAEDNAEAAARWRDFLSRGEQEGTVRIVRPDGSTVEAQYRSRSEYVAERHLPALRHVTKRRRAEQDLRASEARLAAIFDRAAVGLSEIGLDGRFLQVNDELCRILGRTREELLEMVVPQVTHADDVPPSIEALGLTMKTGGPVSFDKRYLRPDGTPVWANSSLTLLRDRRGEPRAVLAVTVDLSERKRLEDELREANETLEARVAERTRILEERTAQLQAQTTKLERMSEMRQELLQRLVTTEEQERRRISRELHDQTGQHLTGLALGLKSLEEILCVYSPPAAGADGLLLQLRAITDELARDIHRMAVEMRPTALDDLGLVPALQSHVERWSQNRGMPIEFDTFGLEGDESRLSEVVETTVYRVVQEALTNVAKYACDGPKRATHVNVTLQRFGGHLMASVEDDGPGFDTDAAEQSGRLGIAGMQERAAFCGGTLEIESAPNRGTKVFIRVPIQPG